MAIKRKIIQDGRRPSRMKSPVEKANENVSFAEKNNPFTDWENKALERKWLR